MEPLTSLGAWLTDFLLLLARLSFVVFLMPGLGERVVSMRTRALVLLALAGGLAGGGVVSVDRGLHVQDLLVVVICELVVGAFLGVALRLSIWMLAIAGSLIAQSIGLGQFLGVALENEAQTVTANLLSMAGAVVLLSANIHVVAVSAFVRVYDAVTAGSLMSLDMEFVTESVFSTFNFAVLLAWPFVAANLLYNICLGFMNRALPQLMVAFVGAPFMVGAGLAFLAVSLGALLLVWKERAIHVIGWL